MPIDIATIRIAYADDGGFYQPKPTKTPKIHLSYIERPTGRKRYISTGTTDLASATAVMNRVIADEQRAVTEAVESPIREIYELYLADRNLTGKANDWHLRPFVAQFGARVFSSLTVRDLVEFKTARTAAAGRFGKKLHPNTYRGSVKAVKTLRDWAVDRNMIPRKLREDLIKIEIPREHAPPKVKALTEDQTDRLWDLLTHGRGRDGRISKLARWAAIAIDTGGRKNAIETLTWDQVDLGAGYIDLELPGAERTDKRRANVQMSPRLRAFLAAVKAEAVSDHVLDAPNWDSEPTWDAALKGGEFEGVNQHLLRHSWATQQLQRGTGLYHVAKALGDDPETVIKRYEHLLPNHLELNWGKRAAAPAAIALAAE